MKKVIDSIQNKSSFFIKYNILNWFKNSIFINKIIFISTLINIPCFSESSSFASRQIDIKFVKGCFLIISYIPQVHEDVYNEGGFTYYINCITESELKFISSFYELMSANSFF